MCMCTFVCHIFVCMHYFLFVGLEKISSCLQGSGFYTFSHTYVVLTSEKWKDAAAEQSLHIHISGSVQHHTEGWYKSLQGFERHLM